MANLRYKYRGINMKGRPIRGVMGAASEADLYARLQSSGIELIQCSCLDKKKNPLAGMFGIKKVQIRDLIQLFLHMEQMQSAGVPLLDALADIRDTTEQDHLRDIMAEIHRDVSEGSSMSEALAQHPKVFTSLYISLIAAGEETGDLTSSYLQLIKYLKWVDKMQAKVRKATRYPMILVAVVILTVVIMMGFVVPQIVGFIKNLDQELPIYTTALMATSDFFKAYWWAVLGTPIFLTFLWFLSRRLSEDIAYRQDVFLLTMPLFGPLIRKINIARFSQTFGALFASGIDVLQGLEHSGKTVSNRAIVDALDGVREQVKAGAPLSEAFNASGEFPSMVVRMLKVGEESGNLTVVLDQVAEFYTADVDEAVEGLIAMIEPFLTALLGGMILWIAVAVFGPIYSSFENLDI
ncbi:MAG: type II secretion system F family protein [Micavibrio aeruginosavorus]|uniref:Type II secretion system F family protein n=1 Tax=Micavibrio aeruginosavorus TaxID=349221 RepID=A0A7T5R1H9_9BACT|nr:MAG: type II secretion system F family protein [Micavibrio aeruginosavorus]